MTCAACGHENRAAAKFCEECAAPLKRLCASCGSELRPTAKFCDECGAALQVPGIRSRVSGPDTQHPTPDTPSEARKVVTIVFADLVGSTALHERLDAESVRRVMERYYRALRNAVEAHGGTVVKLLGDGVMAAFGVPRVAEDDAIRAVRAAVGMQQAFRQLVQTLTPNPSPRTGQGNVPPLPSWERGLGGEGAIGLRVAMNTGEVVVSADNTDVVGDPVNVAARLQQEAQDGDVLIGESTRRLVSELVTLAPVGVFSLKGRSETVAAYRVVSLERPAGAAATAFVGRDDELRRVTAVYDAAVGERRARLAVILGSPGLGKSRLLDEFGRRLGGRATVLSARCEATGGSTFAPIAEALRESLLQAAQASPTPAQGVALGSGLAAPSGLRSGQSGEDQQPQRGDQPIARGNAPGGGGATEDLRTALAAVLADDPDRDRITAGIAALLAGTPGSPEETFFVVRRFLAALASTQPVLLAIDDLQWAEPVLLDLVEHLVQWGTGLPLLVLAAARPELRDVRSSVARTGELVSDVVTLGGLDAAAATRLAANVIGADALPAAVAGRVLATSEGNPLFVGELVRMLVNDGALKREGDQWTAAVDLAALEMPPTIHALLAARIERLAAEDRTVLERAAVIGRQFSRAALAQLLPAEVRAHLDARLEALRRSELIEPDTGWFLGEPALRFHHRLTRDAAYRRVLKGTRAELHGRCADWIEGNVTDAIEHQETIGWHLEQAHQYLRELGPIDAPGRILGERASRYLGAAGRRALARDDVSVAADLLGRALHALNEADRARADLALDWCEALLAAGDVAHAQGAIDELGRWIGEPPRALPWADGWPPLQGCEPAEANAEHQQPQRGGNSLARGNAPGGVVAQPPADLGRLRAWHTCFAGQLAVLTDPQALHPTATAVAAAADELASAGDAAGEAKAHLVHALALSRLGRIGACEAALDKALAAARRGHDRRRANTVLANAPVAALWGPSPVTRASGRCLDVVRVLRITQGAPAVEAVALRCQAALEALRGRSEAARRMISSSRRMVEELGSTQGLLETDHFAGLIALIEGDTAAAEHSLRAAYDGLRTHGLGIDAARAASLLGITLLAQGRAAEAEALSDESEALAGDDLQAGITWRRVRAGALAQRGEHAAAIDFARAAVDIAAGTDVLIHHADARTALATALRAAGRHEEAKAEEARAIELWEAKGATLLAARARQASGRAEPVESASDDRAEPARPVRRRVRANAATANRARLDAAVAARDAEAVSALHADEYETVDHTTGVTYDRQGELTAYRTLMKAEGATIRYEPLATLGDSLLLSRVSTRARGFVGRTFDVGAYESEAIGLFEVDERGLLLRQELFATERLGDAVARLYERYAELLPEGPERARAAATARSVAAFFGPPDFDRYATVVAPDVELVHHRGLVGHGSLRGRDAWLRVFRVILQTANATTSVEDILGLTPEACLVRWRESGTDRASGGPYETTYLMLAVFGPDGLMTRNEYFAPGHGVEALARFDELTGEAPPARREAAQRANVTPSREGEEPLPRPMSETERRAFPPSLAGKGARGGGPDAATTPSTRPRRRVRPNAATANVARLEAAVAARDADALPALYADEYELVDHTTGVTYDRQGELSSLHFLMKAQEATLRHEPLATLADSLFLGRVSMSGTRFAGKTFDVGVYERELVVVGEADAQGRRRRAEQFATDRLGDAVARLYARYAELLPQGPERACAAATARAVAAMLGPLDLDRFNIALAPAVKFVDRQPFGLPSGGSEAFLSGLRSLLEAFAESATRVDDVLALRSDALLVRWTNFGTQRSGGGAYERPLLALWVFGPDGLATRIEFFPPEHDTEALARFDELTDHTRHARNLLAGIQERGVDSCLKTAGMTEGAEPAALRRVRPNAATAHAARTEAVIAARDADALGDLLADDYQTLHHTGLVYNREGALVSWRALLRAQDPNYRLEPLATLGDSLALFRMSVSASRIGRGKFDVGAFERDEIVLLEVDARAQSRRAELFTTDRLGDAIVRLYERYAELLPAGPERTRAAAIARSVALSLRPFDLNRLAEAYAPVIELVDHRTLGTWSAHGVAELLRHWRALFDLADDLAVRDDDILALQPDAFLVSRIFCWTDRASGGAGEVAVLALSAFGADGFLTRIEVFDPGRAAEALARFDELTTERMPPASVQRRVWPNAATAAATRLDAAVATRDAKALPDLFSDDLRCVDHMTHTPWDRQAVLASFRSLLLGEDPAYRHEPLATLGDSLALCRVSLGAARLVRGSFDVGPYEKTDIHLVEADGQGRQRWCEIFAADRLGDAVARLYERYAELLPAGLEHTYAAATARSAALMQRYDFDHHDSFARAFAPGIESVDHRILGTWSAHGAEAVLQNIRSWFDLSDDVALRYDDVLALCPDAFLVHATIFGTDRASGGAFERPYLALWVFGADGLVTGWEQFDLGQEDEALARFDELAGRFPLPGGEGAERTAPRFQNAATRTVDRVTETWRIRDWEGNAALFAPGFRCFDRRKLMRVELDRDQYLDSYRPWLEMPTSVPRFEVLATRGRRLAITRATWEGADDLVGLSALEWLMLVEVNDAGQRVAIVNFDPDDLDAAYAELDRRYDAGDGAALGGVTTRYVQSFAKRDWEGVAALCAPTFVEHDHRRITGVGTTRGADVWVKNNVRAWIDLAPDIVTRFTHIRGHGRGVLWQISLQGSREGGPFEIAFAGVMVLDEQCRVERVDLYDLDRIDEAFARFDELVLSAAEGLPAESSQSLPALLSEAAEAERGAEFPPSLARKGARGFGPETATAPTPRIENAATRAADRLNEAIQALDVERYAAQLAPAFRNVDRRRIVSTGLGRDQFLESFAFIFSRLSSATVASEVLATRGDRLALFRMCIGFTESESGPREIEFLQIFEVDALGRIVAGFGFDPHDLDAAYAELDERYAAGEAAPCG